MSALEDVPVTTLRPPDLQNLAGQTDEEVLRHHLSHSGISMLLACQRKWGWHYDERLELISKPKPLAMGRAFHKGVELGDPDAGAALLDRPTADQAELDRLVIDQATVRAGVRLYLSQWTSDGVTRELEYRIRLRSPYTGAYSRTFDLLGYADGVIDHGSWLELVEDKFVGQIDKLKVKRVRLDRQVSLECYALWRVTGKPVRKVRYRFVRKPSIKQRQNETVEAFVARLEADYVERPEFYSQQEETFRTDDDLLLTEAELWQWAEQLRQAKHGAIYTRNTSSCGEYGGCPFLDLCAGDPDARALYRVRGEDELQEEAKDR